MNDFSELGIESDDSKSMLGRKIEMYRIFNRPIIVHKFKIEPSKYPDKGCGKCLYLQIEFEDEMRVVFNGSANLMDMISRVPEDKFPFKTTIIKKNERHEFT